MTEHGNEPKPECSNALQDLWTFIDGELTDTKRAHITSHLDDCPPCYEAYDFEVELRVVVSQRCRDEVPEELRNRIADIISSIEPNA